MQKIVSIIINKLYAIKCKNNEKKMLKLAQEQLSKNEKNKIDKKFLNICKVMKKLYVDWDKCKYEYFISDEYFQTILLPKLNDVNYNFIGIRHKKSYFMDKNYQEKFIKSFKFPKAIIRKINNELYDSNFNYITYDEALNNLNQYEKVVFKKTLGEGHGKGVYPASKNEYKNLIKDFNDNYVVQEIFKQHESLSKFNASSVNVIRVTSLLLQNEVYILGAILRIGAPGSFCDHVGTESDKPRIVRINENGELCGPAISPDDCKIYGDVFGRKIEGSIPLYDEIIKNVKKEHKMFIHHRIIGWDITIDNNNSIICIEYNSLVPGIVQTQMVCGPVFSQLSKNNKPLLDEIIEMN